MLPVTWNSRPDSVYGRPTALRMFCAIAVSSRGVGAILDQHDELVAAEPRHRVALAQVMAQAPRDVLQQAVAGLVAEAVVDVLEAVEVDEEERELLAAPLRERERTLQRVHEHRAVGQPGELVEVREPADALLGAARLRYVARDAPVAHERAVAIEDRLAGEADEAPLPVGVAHRLHDVLERLARRGERLVAREIGFVQPVPLVERRLARGAARRQAGRARCRCRRLR